MRPRTEAEWKAWREEKRRPWIEAAQRVALLDAFALVSRGVKLRRVGVEQVGPCPSCNGTDRFAIRESDGKWNCRGHGGGTSPVGMVMHIHEVGFLEAVEILAGEPDPARPDAPAVSAEQRAAREQRDRDAAERREKEAAEGAAAHNEWRERERARARKICLDARPWRGSPVEAYLRHRRLIDDDVIEALAGLRLRHAILSYWDLDAAKKPIECGSFPVQVAGMVRAGELVGAHLTYLDNGFRSGALIATAKGKATVVHPETGEILDPKKFRGSSKGSTIRLFGSVAPRVLIRAEGIETMVGFLAALVRAGRLTSDIGAVVAGSMDNLGGPHLGMVSHPTLKTAKGRALRIKGPVPAEETPDKPVMEMPDSVERILDLMDADGDLFAVTQTMLRSKARWERPGRSYHALWPREGQDWAQSVGGV